VLKPMTGPAPSTAAEAAQAGELEAGLATALRLMSIYVNEPSGSQLMTVMHCLRRLATHASLATNPAASTAVAQATALWSSHMLQSRSTCEADPPCAPGRDGDRQGGLH